jgi:hypothetical protein
MFAQQVYSFCIILPGVKQIDRSEIMLADISPGKRAA